MGWGLFSDRRRPTARTRTRRATRLNVETLEARLVPTSVLSWHNDPGITGQNPGEPVLKRANVNQATFGKVFATALDGYVFAQPLFVDVLALPDGSTHSVAFAATEGDSVYAIDANSGQILWHQTLLPTGERTLRNPLPGTTTPDTAGILVGPQVGITSTPVIDPATNTLYTVSVSTSSPLDTPATAANTFQRLHALDITTGAEKVASPVTIAATVNGTGTGSSGGHLAFNPLIEHQRSALTLSNGVVYIEWASHSDRGNYHGWIMGYDASNLSQVAVFNTTPNGNEGGIWASGAGLSVDAQGYFYVNTGNGTFDTTLVGGLPNRGDYGDTLLKLAVDPTTTAANPGPNGWGLKAVDFFTPFNQANLQARDLDTGSGGLLLLPDEVGSADHPHLLITAGKEGRIYLLDRDNLGGYDAATDHIVQEVVGQLPQGLVDTAAYFNGAVYFSAQGAPIRAFSLGNATLSTTPTFQSATSYGNPGATPSVSDWYGSDGIVWALDRANVLRAYNSDTMTELYDSNQAAASRDHLAGSVVKFTTPTVADGMVYVGTTTSLVAYGLIGPLTPPAGLTATTVSDTEIDLNWTDTSINTGGTLIEVSTDGVNWTYLGYVIPGTPTFAATGLNPGTAYLFRVSYINSTTVSAPSDPAFAITTGGDGGGGGGGADWGDLPPSERDGPAVAPEPVSGVRPPVAVPDAFPVMVRPTADGVRGGQPPLAPVASSGAFRPTNAIDGIDGIPS